MPSFRRIFKTIWYVWNLRNLGQVLFIFIFGLVFLFGAAYYGTRDRLTDVPEVMDLDSAHRLIMGDTPRYVTISAVPDFESPIYRTGVWAPFWGNCPPDDIYEIEASDISTQQLRSLLGCMVEVSGNIDIGLTRTVWWPPNRGTDEVTSVSLAPFAGIDEKIWIRSDVEGSQGADIRAWQTQREFSGIVTTWDQSIDSLPADLSGHARRTLPALSDAFVICPHRAYSGKALDFFTTHVWVPVKGTNQLFLWTEKGLEHSYDEGITGVLEPLALTDYQARDRCFAHFETVTGYPLPERIGILKYPTADAYNRKLSGYSGIFMIFGIMWAGFGLIGIFLYIRAPEWIYGAWQRAHYFFATGFETKKSKKGVKPAVESAAPDNGPFGAAETGIRSMYIPPEYLDPPRPSVDPDLHLRTIFENLKTFTPDTRECNLVLIQDFSHHKNPDSGLVLIGCHGNTRDSEAELLNSGQRHPGLAIGLLSVNHKPFNHIGGRVEGIPEAFDMRAHDYVVLCHAPTRKYIQRLVVCKVINGFGEDARRQAESALAAQSVFALMGRVFLIGDSENGPCQGMTKTAGDSIFKAVMAAGR